MSGERLRVHEYTREELREMANGGTYSEVLSEILPEEATEENIINDEGEMVVIPVSEEVHDLANSLAGNGVSVGQVVQFYLFKQKVEKAIPAEELLDKLYNRKN